jgi:sensor histidine kinase YesM
LYIAPESEDVLIPSLLLQPLIENCIKYAIAPIRTNGKIIIKTSIKRDTLQIELSDNGPGCELFQGKIKKGEGIGLTNTRERLRVLYGSRHSFNIVDNQPSGLRFILNIPIELDQKRIKLS